MSETLTETEWNSIERELLNCERYRYPVSLSTRDARALFDLARRAPPPAAEPVKWRLASADENKAAME